MRSKAFKKRDLSSVENEMKNGIELMMPSHLHETKTIYEMAVLLNVLMLDMMPGLF